VTEGSYRLKYKKGDFEVDVQGDKDWVEEKFEELTKNGISAPITTTNASSQTTDPKSNLISVVEFLKSKGSIKSHADRTIIFSYWLHHTENTTSYNAKDIERCYSDARITPPKNINDIMNKNQKKGYLMPASAIKDSAKTWVITQSGEDYVNQLK